MCIGINWRPIIKCDNCGRDCARWGVDITWKDEQTKYYWAPFKRCPFCQSDNTRRMTDDELKKFFDSTRLLE